VCRPSDHVERLFAAEAKSRGVAVEALRQEEILSKVPEPTDAEIEQVYRQILAARPGGVQG